MTDQPEIPNVSMANTKKELIEAYEAAKKGLQGMGKDLLDAEKAKKRLEKELAAATANTQAAQDPIQRLHDLRGAISRELTDLTERFETEIDTYRKIQAAIRDKNEEIKTLYNVETAASDLAALIDANRIKKQQFALEMEEKRSGFEEEMDQAHAIWEREKSEYKHKEKEHADALDKMRKREKEEFEYAFTREKEQRKNDLEDELKLLEKEIEQKRETFEKAHQQRKTDIDAREANLEKVDKEMAALRKEVDTFPERLAKDVQKAVNETTGSLTREFGKDKELLESRFEGEKNVLAGKIESLEKMVASQAAQISELSKSREKAYEKVQDIANRAVATVKKEVYTVPMQPVSTGAKGEQGRND